MNEKRDKEANKGGGGLGTRLHYVDVVLGEEGYCGLSYIPDPACLPSAPESYQRPTSVLVALPAGRLQAWMSAREQQGTGINKNMIAC